MHAILGASLALSSGERVLKGAGNQESRIIMLQAWRGHSGERRGPGPHPQARTWWSGQRGCLAGEEGHGARMSQRPSGDGCAEQGAGDPEMADVPDEAVLSLEGWPGARTTPKGRPAPGCRRAPENMSDSQPGCPAEARFR